MAPPAFETVGTKKSNRRAQGTLKGEGARAGGDGGGRGGFGAQSQAQQAYERSLKDAHLGMKVQLSMSFEVPGDERSELNNAKQALAVALGLDVRDISVLGAGQRMDKKRVRWSLALYTGSVARDAEVLADIGGRADSMHLETKSGRVAMIRAVVPPPNPALAKYSVLIPGTFTWKEEEVMKLVYEQPWASSNNGKELVKAVYVHADLQSYVAVFSSEKAADFAHDQAIWIGNEEVPRRTVYLPRWEPMRKSRGRSGKIGRAQQQQRQTGGIKSERQPDMGRGGQAGGSYADAARGHGGRAAQGQQQQQQPPQQPQQQQRQQQQQPQQPQQQRQQQQQHGQKGLASEVELLKSRLQAVEERNVSMLEVHQDTLNQLGKAIRTIHELELRVADLTEFSYVASPEAQAKKREELAARMAEAKAKADAEEAAKKERERRAEEQRAEEEKRAAEEKRVKDLADEAQREILRKNTEELKARLAEKLAQVKSRGKEEFVAEKTDAKATEDAPTTPTTPKKKAKRMEPEQVPASTTNVNVVHTAGMKVEFPVSSVEMVEERERMGERTQPPTEKEKEAHRVGVQARKTFEDKKKAEQAGAESRKALVEEEARLKNMQKLKELRPKVQARIKLAAEAEEAAKVNKAQSKGVKKEFVPLGREWSAFAGLEHARALTAGYQAMVIKSDAEWFLVIDTDDDDLWDTEGAMHEDKPGSEGSFLLFKVFDWCVDAGVPGKVQLEGAPRCFKGGWTDLKFSKTSSREEDDNLCAMARDWVAQRNVGATAAAAQSGQ
jgi:hypothetical protein